MFRKTSACALPADRMAENQFGMFSSPLSLLSGKSKKLYENHQAWHNIFRQQVTMRINESIFSELFC